MDNMEKTNPLEVQPVGKLMMKFAIPAILSGVISSLYNIVDQIFIGQSVGMLGNAATNVAFPLIIFCTGISLLLGIGTAANFSLSLGEGKRERAGNYAGTGITALIIAGFLIMIVGFLFMNPLIQMFGATADAYDYALEYVAITMFGLPFYVISCGGTHLIRADQSPRYAMVCVMSGALLNLILDPLFIFGFNMGIAGAAYATVIGQVVSGILTLAYFKRFKTVQITRKLLRPRLDLLTRICALGVAPCVNQLSMMVVQIALNNVLTHYGRQSLYGPDIPLACVGVITKVNSILIMIMVGLAQGAQPIVGFNYGAKNYTRVKETLKKNVTAVVLISFVAFLSFQLLPRQITSIFGVCSKEYYDFAGQYFRIFLFFTFINGLQPIAANFFTSIGKATKGLTVSVTRQLVFLLPLIIILPIFFGIDGVLFAGPIADFVAFALTVIFLIQQVRLMNRAIKNREAI